MEASKQPFAKKAVIVGIQLLVALLHFVTGSSYRGPYPAFVNGYLIDILLPFALYFLLSLVEHRVVARWYIRCLLVFGVGSVVELMQYAGAPVLGSTFDPLDFLMYGVGVGLAAIFDTLLFPRIFRFWSTGTPLESK